MTKQQLKFDDVITMTGNLVYKCRKCGRIDNDFPCSSALMDLTSIISEDLRISRGSKVIIHQCSENEYGVADLIGVEINKEK